MTGFSTYYLDGDLFQPLTLSALKGKLKEMIRYYKIKGSDWMKKLLNIVPKEDKQVILHLLRNMAHLGGKKRAKTAKRDAKGRFS